MNLVLDPRQTTPSPIIIDEAEDYFDQESIVQANFEFSDNEMELDEMRVRTRSQSRTKETSVPPAEPKAKVARAKKVMKAVEVKPRQRRRIHVDEIESDED